MSIRVGLSTAQQFAKLRKRKHLYTKAQQNMIKKGLMKRRYDKKFSGKKFVSKHKVPLAFGAGLGLGFLED
jgi:high-affinity nickel permease|tara:strand:+ start:53 stop:265 length:213 start_codon:yes stop_codon:yes gene_type:complete